MGHESTFSLGLLASSIKLFPFTQHLSLSIGLLSDEHLNLSLVTEVVSFYREKTKAGTGDKGKCKLHEGSGFASVHCYKQCLVHTERRKGGREGMTRCPVPLSTLLSTDRLSSRARAQGCGSTEPGMWQ